MEYLLRFMQVHETFRLAEIKSLAILEGIDLEIISYNTTSPFCIVKLPNDDAARRLVSRSILTRAIYELWGSGTSYDSLHSSIRSTSQHLWPTYQSPSLSFKFTVDTFQGSRSMDSQYSIINQFSYLSFKGPIRMKNPSNEWCVMENWDLDAQFYGITSPKSVYLGRLIGKSSREAVVKYDLKKRKYISTTSMDAELSLVTANITLAAKGKLFYDPFVGTGSFPLACAHFGAEVFGSDIDGRSIRGKGGLNVLSNFRQYGLMNCFGDCFVADLTNTPIRSRRWLDGIVCDPPYGVREGLKVLGNRDPNKSKEPVIQDGVESHLLPSYIPPKKPYSFPQMLTDILSFASTTLLPNARLSLWIPTANEAEPEKEIPPPTHPHLEIVSVCTQSFNKWSRNLVTYRRLEDAEVEKVGMNGLLSELNELDVGGEKVENVRVEAKKTANELNPFREGYFKGFRIS